MLNIELMIRIPINHIQPTSLHAVNQRIVVSHMASQPARGIQPM